ncbi:hypothetical protein RhiirA4_451598 [Rhizophagus irregularis]|uniref:B30.2/SPRY domain-containing protein n=1 Tax=Rhizophagus irregularis TaxID=588596 RepID=A0A2I1FW40_9GLOM|nr:hypothetical protein RhiirA4_451598 [Rhizophagus irregularis]
MRFAQPLFFYHIALGEVIDIEDDGTENREYALIRGIFTHQANDYKKYVFFILDWYYDTGRIDALLDVESMQSIIEKFWYNTWVGICESENFSYESWAGCQPTGWALGTCGYFHNSNKGLKYCSQFQNNDVKVTVHLNMYKKTCAFSVNDTKYSEVLVNSSSSKLYPVVSFCNSARIRIPPYRKV